MKPLSIGALAGLLFAMFQGTSATVAMTSLAAYDGAVCSSGLGSLTVIPGGSAQACSSSGAPASKTTTTSDSTFKTDAASAFGASAKYVTVSTFTGSTCTVANLVTATFYNADGNCHPITLSSQKYFTVTAAAIGGAPTITFYTDAACTGPVDPSTAAIAVTRTQLQTTTSSVVGCVVQSGTPTQYEVSSGWPVALEATTSFDGNDCVNGALGFISITSNSATCSAHTNCANGVGKICTLDTTYYNDFAGNSLFGTTPHVIISTYSTGSACVTSALSSISAYAADGKCHKISATKYYNVLITAGGATATIQLFSDATCKTQHTDSPNTIPVTQAVVGASSGCDGANRIRYEFSTNWPRPRKAVTTYDEGDCTKAVGQISMTTAVCTITNSVNSDVDCASGSGEICTTNYNYDSAIATTFGTSIPYVTIAKFSGTACSWSTLQSVKAYLADGKCHKTDNGKSYKLAVAPIGVPTAQEPKILAYSDDACASADTSNDISVTKSKLNTGSGCDGAAQASLYKVSANWPKAMSVVGVGAYTVPTSGACVGGVPSKLTLTDASVGNALCGATRACSSITALADCTTVTDYKTYLKTAFGSVPYLIKETYSTGCATLSSVVAWAADGTCYEDGAGSFKAVVTSTGVSVKTWTSVKDCSAASPGDTSVTAANLVSNACVSNTAKYYMGGSWVLGSSAVYDDSKCALTPNKLTLGWAPTCTTPTGADACVETATTGANAKTVYNAPGCAKTSTYFPTIDKAFGMTSYVVQESYTSNCGSLIGVTAYVADAKCHLGADAISSYNVTYDVNGTTAQVKIDSFTNTDCTAPVATTASVAATAIAGKTCVADTKTYVGGLATQLTAVTTYSDKDCKVPVQTVFTSSATTCTASAATACTAAGTLYTKTACTNAKTDYAAVLATIYGTTRRLVTDIYEAKDAKCGVRQGIVAYIGDATCHATLDATTFFKVTLGSSNTATDATFSTFSDKECTKDEKSLKIAAANLATATTAPCDTTNFIKFSIGGTEPVTEAPATDAPTPAPTTAVSTGSGKSAAVSSFSVSIFGLLASILGGLVVLLN